MRNQVWDWVTDPNTGKPARMAAVLFGLVNLPPDQGLQTNNNTDHGRRMPGIAKPYFSNTPQAFSKFDSTFNWFTAQGIPMSPVDDAGHLNSYPLMRVQALDTSNKVVATTDAVVPVSSEVDCRDCHTRGLSGADPTARLHGPIFVAPVSVHRYAKEHAAKINIVRLHDFKHGTALEAKQPVVCASCHRSNALAGVGGPQGDPRRDSMSRATHDYHGKLMIDANGNLVRDKTGEPVLSNQPASLGDQPLIPTSGPMEGNCFRCHPGKITQCFRGVMRTAGLFCADCHGGMLSVGGEYKLKTGSTRVPWVNEPHCESCHQGVPSVLRLAYSASDPAATPVIPSDPRFAVENGALYRNSHGHGGVACEGCHGSPHAVWPVGNPNGNDNVTARQLQGHAGKLTECTVCHKPGSFPQGTLSGPHGLHPINDQNWVRSHHNWAGGDSLAPSAHPNAQDPCAACHGADHRGTRLSKAAADRTFKIDSGTITIKAGTMVGCFTCHGQDNAVKGH